MAWDTAANIISDAALELGLIKVAVANPFASTDQNILQLNALLSSLGQELLRDYQWSHLQKEATFPTVASTANYDLPTDFARIVNGTAWNRTRTRPLTGPVTGAQWQELKSVSGSAAATDIFRIWKDDIWIHPTPSSADDIYYEYVSKLWVAVTAGTETTKEAPTIASDELWFDRQVLITGLKWKHVRAKSKPSQAEQEDFLRAITRAQGADGGAPAICVTPSRWRPQWNAPGDDGTWGT